MDVRREPATLLALVAAAVQLVSAFFFALTPDQQGLINAAAVAVVGVLTALAVKGEKLLAAIVGVGQAAIALGAGFGAQLAADQQSALMVALTIGTSFWLRTQVVAPVPPVTSRAIAVEEAGFTGAEPAEKLTPRL